MHPRPSQDRITGIIGTRAISSHAMTAFRRRRRSSGLHATARCLTQVHIDAIFKDRRILHKVPREEIPDGWRPYWYGAGGPSIYLEVNDRTINVYMQELIATKTPQIPGNPRSTGRTDVMLAWTHTY